MCWGGILRVGDRARAGEGQHGIPRSTRGKKRDLSWHALLVALGRLLVHARLLLVHLLLARHGGDHVSVLRGVALHLRAPEVTVDSGADVKGAVLWTLREVLVTLRDWDERPQPCERCACLRASFARTEARVRGLRKSLGESVC